MRMHALGLLALWVAVTGAAAPLPLAPPPPDLPKLVPFVSAPLAKPPVMITSVTPPPPPLGVDPIPPVALTLPTADKPVAPLPEPRALPCVAAWTTIATEALECGRAHFQKGEYEQAIKALDTATRTKDPDVGRESRYWLGEAYARAGRPDQASALFRQVVLESPPPVEQRPWALHSNGWANLALGNAEVARQAFTQLLAAPMPVPLDVWGRHGLALASYALGRYADAEQAWSALLTRPLPAWLARDVAFWYGETLGRTGQYARAEVELAKFTQGGVHPLLDSGILRRGWWGLAAKDYADSAGAFQTYLAPRAGSGASERPGTPRSARAPAPARAEREWADAGLTLALLGSGDWAGAQSAAAALTARQSGLALPVLLRVVAHAVDTSRGADAQALIERLLGGTLTTPVRAWLLFEKGQAYAVDGNRDEARTQYELARDADPAGETGRVAAFFLARTNFDLREFAQAAAGVEALLGAPLGGELRAAALLLQGEAAYQAGDMPEAARSFRRFLTEFPNHERTPLVRLALAWTALRQDQSSEALRQFQGFARTYPDHPSAIDALELASELVLDAGDAGRAREILDQILSMYGANPRSEFARLNSAILLLHIGQAKAALPLLRDWIARVPFPPLLGRAYAALGAALLASGAPKDAASAFARAETEGVGALAALGHAAAALEGGDASEAARAFAEARDTGTRDIAAAGEYGLAVVKFKSGALGEFKPVAQKALDASPRAPSAPRLLYVLTGIAVAEKDWPGALATARRLVVEFPTDAAADDALERVGTGAAAAQAWPAAYDAWGLLREKYPDSPFVAGSAVGFAEAQMRTGRVTEALGGLEKAVAATPSDPRAWLMLGRTRETTGDRQGALEAYVRAERDGQGADRGRALLGHARLLVAENRTEEARGVLQGVLQSETRSVVLEAALIIGDTYQRDGEHLAATEYYMTAAYLDPQSSFGRRALLAAAQSFAALKQRAAAATVYGKLLAQADVPADMAEAARQGLAALGR